MMISATNDGELVGRFPWRLASLAGEHNYCRNPDGEPTAWCYTTDPASRWELCDVGEVSAAGSDECPVTPADPTDPCDLDVDDTGTIIQDGGQLDFDGGHSNGQDCRWTITCSSGTPTVTFTTFDTESNYDFVNAFDGENVAAEQVAHIAGSDIPDPISGTTSTMLIQFTSDGSVTNDGFLAAVTCESGGIEWEAYDAAHDSVDTNSPTDTNHAGHFGAGFIDYLPEGLSADDQYITFTVSQSCNSLGYHVHIHFRILMSFSGFMSHALSPSPSTSPSPPGSRCTHSSASRERCAHLV